MARTNKKLSEETKKRACRRHNWVLQYCWNYERMQASGWAYAMIPVMQELYDTNEEVCQNLERHMQFYNSNTNVAAMIFGAAVALEEDYQPEMASSIKVALMGPMASIGDTINAVLVQPFAYMMAASMAAEGSYMALPWIFIPFFLLWLGRFPLFSFGYKRSVHIIEDIGDNTDFALLRDGASILGLVVAGGFVPSMVNVSIKWSYTRMINEVEKTIHIQDTLNGILPYLLPICFVALCYWMLKIRSMKPLTVIGVIATIGFVLGALGIL